MPAMAEHLHIADLSIPLVRRPMWSIRLRVCSSSGAVKVSAPRHVSREMIYRFVEAKLPWIREHRQKVLSRPPQPLWQRFDKATQQQYRTQLLEQLPPLIAHYEKVLQVSVTGIGLRHMKTRWGTCNTHTRRVCFNLELARRTPEALEYVVAHELAHLRVPGHGPRFHALLDEVMPDWRARKLTLRY